ncbi:MAG: long-chain fatty acid--CoA ligase [Marinilabiliales bacterium]|nr:long-chain fatty acid--CoA ligase [Marinilabiliales bacterium]
MVVTRTFDLLEHCLLHCNREDAVAGKQGNQWIKYSTEEFARRVELLALGFLSMGLKRGDRVSTVSGNRPEWSFVDMALAMVGAVHVPVYPTISEDEYSYIFQHAEIRYLFVSDEKLYRKLIPVVGELQGFEKVFTFNEVEGAEPFASLLALGEEKEHEFKDQLIGIRDSIHPDDMVTMIYTSGTTGVPKGVMLSHNNIVSNMEACSHHFDLGLGHRSVSFLPLCHIFERTVNYIFIYRGIGIYYVESLSQIVQSIKEVKPHILTAVPRLLESVYDGIMAKGKLLSGIKFKLFFWAVELGKDFDFNQPVSPIRRLKLRIADKLIYSKWREGLGGNIQLMVSGGALLQSRIARVFSCAGLKVVEGYGLTETSPVIAVSNVVTGEIKIGTNGPIIKGVTVKIAEDGEILVKGPNLMLGYYKEPGLTADVIDSDGWFHTGDVGMLDEGKYLKITDRKKEIFKLSGGKYIAPQLIENKLKESVLIEQACVIGSQEKFASALISPNFVYLHECCPEHKILFKDNVELINHPEVLAMYQAEVKEVNKTLGQHEEIKRFRLVADTWSAQTGELSQTLKLKRKVIEQKYGEIIEEIFASSRED